MASIRNIDDKLYHDAKVRAAQTDMTVKALVERAIREYLAGPNEEVCSQWAEDNRWTRPS